MTTTFSNILLICDCDCDVKKSLLFTEFTHFGLLGADDNVVDWGAGCWCCRVEINVETSCSSSFDALLMMNEFLIRLGAQLHTALGFPSFLSVCWLAVADRTQVAAWSRWAHTHGFHWFDFIFQRRVVEWMIIRGLFTGHIQPLEITRFSMYVSIWLITGHYKTTEPRDELYRRICCERLFTGDTIVALVLRVLLGPRQLLFRVFGVSERVVAELLIDGYAGGDMMMWYYRLMMGCCSTWEEERSTTE